MNIKRQQGFTLIEVLVASAILIASMGVILQLFNAGLNGMHRAGKAQHLLLAQRSIYSSLQIANPLAESARTGEMAGFEYTWDAEPVGQAFIIQANEGLGATRVQLHKFTVSLGDGQSEANTFEFVRIIHQPVDR